MTRSPRTAASDRTHSLDARRSPAPGASNERHSGKRHHAPGNRTEAGCSLIHTHPTANATTATAYSVAAATETSTAFARDVVVRPVADVAVRRRIYVSARRGGLGRPALAAMVEALRQAAAAPS